MERLIKSGLMFGNLVHVASPALVERYNRALEHLTGKTTQLTDFYIDISGYSPEVGHEFGDALYLNHQGVNRQFILLTTEQKRAPLLDAKFSTSRSILRQFIDANESALFALTARDAVAGELVNSVFSLNEPARLFDMRAISVEADTTNGRIRRAGELDGKVATFLNEEDAWFDDVLISEMIALAGETGDILRNPVELEEMSFEQRNFWTAHFGGLYVFQDLEQPAVIAVGDRAELGEVPVAHVMDLSDRNRLAHYLDVNGLVEPIVKARGIDAAAVLRQKMDFILVNALAGEGVALTDRTKSDMRRLARAHADALPEEFHLLGALVNWAENSGPWPTIEANSPAYFYTLRAANHKDADLVNMLLSELAPKDFRQMFICHKELFYAHYAGWTEAKKEYVVSYLAREYQVDKLGAREALFGHEPPMVEQDRTDLDRMVDLVGPWGPVRGR